MTEHHREHHREHPREPDPAQSRATPPGHPALRRLLPVEPEFFARRYWGTTPLHHRAADLPALLTLADVDELLSRRGLRTPFLRLAKDGTVLPTARYTGGGGAGASVPDQVVDDQVLSLFDDGATIVLQGLHRLWPPLVEFTAQLVTDLGHPCQVNAYVTPPDSRGFDPHYDVHDVFVLQFAGSKQWRIHAPVHPDPLPTQPWTDHRDEVAARAKEQPLLEVTLAPGDVLYLPRGTIHAAAALGAVSGHLTIGVHPVTRQHLVAALLAAVADAPDLRRALPLGFSLDDSAVLGVELKATVTALGQLLDTVTAQQLADRLAPRLFEQTRPAPLSPIAQATALTALTVADELAWRPGLASQLRADGADVALVLPTRTLRFEAAEAGAVAQLREQGQCRVADLSCLDSGAALELGRRLLREGVAVPREA